MAREILVVDDETDIRMLIGGILQDEGYETREAADAAGAIEEVARRLPSLVILDVWLEGSELDGIEVLRRLRRDHPQLPVVVISGHGTIEMAVAAIQDGAYEFIEKPFNTDRLLLSIERALETTDLKRENEELRSRGGWPSDVAGNSPVVRNLRLAAERVAPTASRVLVTGPPGAGKEVVARFVHARSRAAKGAFVVVNCAAMLPERVEEELFGIEGKDGNGARVGYFERAHGGTLFLDEISDMPLETQGKIVRILQDNAFVRIGGDGPVHVRTRVIASTQRDLASEIAAGRFREDLFYRLNVVPIEVPPLRERRDDIPDLASHFLAIGAVSAGQPQRELAEDAIAVLQSYDWPGNVRQLKNVMDWLLIMAGDDIRAPIRAEHLPPELTSAGASIDDPRKREALISLPLREAREAFERDYLVAQVNRFGGNISRTAAFIGMERSALHRKLKALNVQVGDR